MIFVTALFAILLLVIIILADTGRLGFLSIVYAFPFGDKAGHFILFGILSFLVVLTMLRSRHFSRPRLVAVSVTLFLALLAAAEEYSQKFFALRTFSLPDLFSSWAGLVLGAWLAWKKTQKGR
jgi:VanZ family protein